jgi:hypothetical protein
MTASSEMDFASRAVFFIFHKDTPKGDLRVAVFFVGANGL